MAAPDPRSDIRRANRTTPLWIAIAVLAVVVGLVVRDGDDGDREVAGDAGSTTAADPATTAAPEEAVVHGIADGEAGPVAASSDDDDLPPGDASSDYEALQAPVVSTGGWVVALVDGGTLLAGELGQAMAPVGPGTPVSRLVASDRPAAVWVGVAEGRFGLVDLTAGEVVEEVEVGPGWTVGPATGGVVVAEPDGGATSRRPGETPAPVPLPPGSTAVDAGGDLVLADGPTAPDGGRTFTVLRLDGTVVRTFEVEASTRPGAIATDGSTVAVPVPDGWEVRDVESGELLGSLPPEPGDAAWVGDGRFAVYALGRVVLSDGREVEPPWLLRALADAGA